VEVKIVAQRYHDTASGDTWAMKPFTFRARLSWRLLLLGAALLAAGIIVFALLRLPGRPPEAAIVRAANVSPDPVSLPSGSQPLERLRALARGANVVICVIDAARADHVGCYGYPRDTTPNIDRIAEDALVFERHFCPYPLTLPSTASLLRSLHPDSHLATGLWHALSHASPEVSDFTMAQGLQAAGYETAFFSSNICASPAVGIGCDFQHVYAAHGPGGGPHSAGRRSDRIRGSGSEAVLSQGASPAELRVERTSRGSPLRPDRLLSYISDWLQDGPRSPFFAYIHFLPPHLPYNAPEHMKQLFAGAKPPCAWQGRCDFPADKLAKAQLEGPPLKKWVNAYDANMRWADWAVAGLETLLRETDLLDNTILVITADHGEAFGEHGYRYHGHGVYDELTRVPFILRLPGPGRPVGKISALTETMDLLPTIFALLALSYPEDQVQGSSLLPLLTGETDHVHECVFARGSTTYLVRDLHAALILHRDGITRALYDLDADPLQTRNVIRSQPERAAELVEAFREFAATQRRQPLRYVDPTYAKPEVTPEPRPELSEEMRRELKAIGYVY
jgi:arylsulfatase A-like enzyme